MTERTLGGRLRELRGATGLSLREAAAKAEINPGYLSQLERDEIQSPSPAILQKLAEAYDEPLLALMQWAGYVEDVELSANQARALKYIGQDVSDEELQAVKAVLDAIRSTRTATFRSLDGPLSADDRARIRGHVVATLRRADAFGEIPTPLGQVMEVANLVAAGEIELEPRLQQRLRDRFGDLVDRALERLLGAIRFDSREIFVKQDMYRLKRRFVEAHELGHELLPWHNRLYAFLDDKQRLTAQCHDYYERQANQAAIELLAQGDRLRHEADDSPITIDAIDYLGGRFQVSTHATARYVVEESKQEVALAVGHFGMYGKVMPAHLYCSASFEERLRWKQTGAAGQLIQQLLVAAKREEELEPLLQVDARGRAATIALDSLRTRYAVFVLFRCLPVRRRVLIGTATT